MSMIYSKKEFAEKFNCERVRADRTGQEFSLIVFELQFAKLKRKREMLDWEAVAHLIRNRIRCYDEIGWIEKNRFGVLLPGTSYAGAHKVADTICFEIIPQTFKFTCNVLTYPSHWTSSKWEQSNNDHEGDHIDAHSWASANEKLIRTTGINEMKGMPLWKRCLDIIVGIAAMLMLMPVMLAISMYIKAVSPGPVFFRQQRVGYLGKTFTCWKFRTMHTHADESSHNSYYRELMNSSKSMKKLDEKDPRIIPFGKLIRKTGLDELPQLFNVISGEMSLIGPRPCIPYEAEEYRLWQRRRFDAVPGLTGLWQVSGKNKTTFDDMMRYDIRYSAKKSFFMDLVILVKTIPAIIAQATDK